MIVTLDLPDTLATDLGTDPSNLSRQILEGYARDAYRSGRLTVGQLQALMGYGSDAEIEAFLQPRDRYPLRGTTPYSYEDPFEPAIPPKE